MSSTSDNFQSPPPNPKDYSSFEDYERAMKMHEDFLGKCKEVDEVMARTETEEEFKQEMEKLGFTCHEDEYCETEWCQKNEECLAVALEHFQNTSDEYFFWKMLPEVQKIIHLRFEGNNCDLAPDWKNPNTKEGKSVRFCLEVHDALVFENASDSPFVELVKQKEVQDFGRVLYLFLQKVLMGKKFPNRERKEIYKFLKDNKILKTKVNVRLLKILEGFW